MRYNFAILLDRRILVTEPGLVVGVNREKEGMQPEALQHMLNKPSDIILKHP
jgi:hypothetical protein